MNVINKYQEDKKKSLLKNVGNKYKKNDESILGNEDELRSKCESPICFEGESEIRKFSKYNKIECNMENKSFTCNNNQILRTDGKCISEGGYNLEFCNGELDMKNNFLDLKMSGPTLIRLHTPARYKYACRRNVYACQFK